MVNLLKRKAIAKLPTFPKINANDDFRKKFFKLAKYFSKVNEVDDYIESLSFIVDEDLSDFQLMDLDNVHLNDDIDFLVRTIVESRAKASTLSGVKVIFSEDSSKVYAILPDCTSRTDGNTYKLRKSQKHDTLQFFSVGYLLLASFLEKSVSKVRPAEFSPIFFYSNENWKRYRMQAQALYNIAIDTVFKLEYNHSLNMKFSVEGGKSIATFRTDKKYQDETLNKNTIFNKMGFRKVEVDTETYEGEPFDYKEFARVEQDFAAIVDRLPHAAAEPELKFRKLGKHKAWGIYSPMLNILAVDIRHTESMIHEYGHYLDFKHGSETYSETPQFAPIIDGYGKKLAELSALDAHADVISKLEYYMTPTEVFARAFELWVHGTIVSNSSVLHSSEAYNERAEYLALHDMKEMIYSYFESIFPSSQLAVQQYAANLASKPSKVLFASGVNAEPTVGEQLSLF